MRIDVITLFPEFFEPLKSHSIVGRAIGSGKIDLVTHNLREFANDKYRTVDDHPYGGGAGMVLKFDVMLRAIENVKSQINTNSQITTILLTPQGQVYNQGLVNSLKQKDNIILLCGHYEGFDERIRDYVDLEISIGDYILTGGEIPAMVILDSVARLIPGVLGDDESSQNESFGETMDFGLEYPQYTRPKEHKGKKVPEILLSGNHQEISDWRREQAKIKTKERRPDLSK